MTQMAPTDKAKVKRAFPCRRRPGVVYGGHGGCVEPMLIRSCIGRVLALGLLVTSCHRPPAPRPADQSPPPPEPRPVERPTHPQKPVGVTTREYEDARRGRKLNTTIWYPAVPCTEEEIIWWDGIFPGHGAWEAPLKEASRPFPVVLLSHGSGGDGPNLAWLAEGLVARGYVVVAVDHPGDRFGDVSQDARLAAWRRALDLSLVLSRLLVDPTFGRRIDRRRIGAAGHSSGAFTVLQLAGARFRPEHLLEYCAGPRAGPDCALIAGADLPDIPDRWEASKQYRDRRVHAVLALAPVLGPGVTSRSLRQITIPTDIVASKTDELVPFELNAARYARLIPHAHLTVVPDAGHFVFMPVCTEAGRFIAAPVCVDASPSVDRAAVHERAVAHAVEFFGRSLGVR
jgi:predicted dienelactone hydrolase